MSQATLKAIEDAIACASDVSMETTNYVHMAPEAPLHNSLGLIRLADNRLVALINTDDD